MRAHALRFTGGLPASAALVLIGEGPTGFTTVGADDLPGLLALAAIPGLLALWLYDRGLANTPASAATVAELAFPPSAIVINRVAFGTTLTTSQWAGIALLSGTFLVLGSALAARLRARRRGGPPNRISPWPPWPFATARGPYLEARLEPEELAVAVRGAPRCVDLVVLEPAERRQLEGDPTATDRSGASRRSRLRS